MLLFGIKSALIVGKNLIENLPKIKIFENQNKILQ